MRKPTRAYQSDTAVEYTTRQHDRHTRTAPKPAAPNKEVRSRSSLPVDKRFHISVEQGIAEVRGEDYVFVKDHVFSSPSTAGAIVVGGNINGRITWKTADGRTFQQLEDQALSA